MSMGRLVRTLCERFELLAFFHAGRLPTWRHEIQRKASFRTLGKGGVKRLPKPLIAGIDPPRRGHVAEWLRSGLQSRMVFPFDQRHFRNYARNRTQKAIDFAAKISISEIRLPGRSYPSRHPIGSSSS